MVPWTHLDAGEVVAFANWETAQCGQWAASEKWPGFWTFRGVTRAILDSIISLNKGVGF